VRTIVDRIRDARTVSEGNDIVAVGGDLEPATLLGAYAQGLFPMRVDGVLAWWSPDPRGILRSTASIGAGR
jgi:leucyl/phenylalanyl-tRNA--protein transferase